ncbi:MAG TPA: polysaccharide deacetylase family protein, partial [Polyangiaceae bacterium]|nr:polysaccharide deacetylase family protein [Polyangiaceae bacterium]
MTTGRAILLTATLAALALVARSLFSSPAPLWVAVTAFVGYGALVTWGVLDPSLEMFAEVLWRGPEGAKGVALTFDDGPHPTHTRAVLDALDRAGAKATFFVIGEKAREHGELLREMVARGHLVAIHGDRHDRALSFRPLAAVRADLARAIAVVEGALGERPRFYRPAVGQTNPRIARAAADLGLTIVGWSVRSRDGVRARTDTVARRVVSRLGDGEIVLLHDAA